MNGINVSKFIQLIKKAAKIKLVWQRTDDAEYIASGAWSVKVPTTAGTKVRAVLFEAFGREAQLWQSLSIVDGSISENGMDITKLYKSNKAMEYGRLTPVALLDNSKGGVNVRLVVLGKQVAGINNSIAEMLDDSRAAGSGGLNPIYFGGNQDILIMPVNSTGSWRKKLAEYIPQEAQL